MPTMILQVLQFVQGALPEVVALWRQIHQDDPEKANWTDVEAIQDLIDSGDKVAAKWAAYKQANP